MAGRKKRTSDRGGSSSSSWFYAVLTVPALAALGLLWWHGGQGTTPEWTRMAWWKQTFTSLEQAASPPASRVINPPPVKIAQIQIPPAQSPTPTLPPPAQIRPAVTNDLHKIKPDLTLRTNILTVPAPTPIPEPVTDRETVHPVRTLVEAQIALARLGISVGCIDGAAGSHTHGALQAYQSRENGLPITGELDAETKQHLTVEEPLYTEYGVTIDDLAGLHPIGQTWQAKSEQSSLAYETILELVAEKGQASQPFIRSLNPNIDWAKVHAGTAVKIPRIERTAPSEHAAFIRIHLLSKTVQAFDSKTNLLAHFPCSIAQKVEKRPVGTLHIARLASHPNYVFDPAVFPESEEAQKIGHKLVLPPGPNNPVGLAWIGLDKPGYGMHGTPKPEQIGRTESHGCFRLTNWDAEYLLSLTWVGMSVYVEH